MRKKTPYPEELLTLFKTVSYYKQFVQIQCNKETAFNLRAQLYSARKYFARDKPEWTNFKITLTEYETLTHLDLKPEIHANDYRYRELDTIPNFPNKSDFRKIEETEIPRGSGQFDSIYFFVVPDTRIQEILART